MHKLLISILRKARETKWSYDTARERLLRCGGGHHRCIAPTKPFYCPNGANLLMRCKWHNNTENAQCTFERTADGHWHWKCFALCAAHVPLSAIRIDNTMAPQPTTTQQQRGGKIYWHAPASPSIITTMVHHNCLRLWFLGNTQTFSPCHLWCCYHVRRHSFISFADVLAYWSAMCACCFVLLSASHGCQLD